MSRPTNRKRGELDQEKRRQYAVSEARTAQQAFKFIEDYVVACGEIVRKHGARRLLDLLKPYRASPTAAPVQLQQDLYALEARFGLAGFGPVDPKEPDDFDPAVARAEPHSNALRPGSRRPGRTWLQVVVNPACTEAEWLEARLRLRGTVEDQASNRIERRRTWDDDFGPKNGFTLLRMQTKGATKRELRGWLQAQLPIPRKNRALDAHVRRMLAAAMAAVDLARAEITALRETPVRDQWSPPPATEERLVRDEAPSFTAPFRL